MKKILYMFLSVSLVFVNFPTLLIFLKNHQLRQASPNTDFTNPIHLVFTPSRPCNQYYLTVKEKKYGNNAMSFRI